MVALSSDDGFVDVTRVETSDVALGGNEVNTPNKQFVELASRDQWLKDELESRTGTDATAIASFNRSRDLSQAAIAQGRLTLATGDPSPSSDQTAATTLYYTPYNGDLVSLWNDAESRWDVYQFTERSLSLSGLAANANYDIFLYDNGGTLTLQAVGWSNSGAGTSERASAISRRNGAWVKTSDNRRYLGTIRTTATIGQCEDSKVRRFVWNVQNQLFRKCLYQFAVASSWTYATAAWRGANNSADPRIEVVTGLETDCELTAGLNAGNNVNVAIGRNTSTTPSSIDEGIGLDGLNGDVIGVQANIAPPDCFGYEYFQIMEFSASGSTTITGENSGVSAPGGGIVTGPCRSGIYGTIRG